MQARERRVRRSIAVGLVGVGFTLAFAVRGHAQSVPQDADVFVLKGVFQTTAVMPTSLGWVDYSVSSGVCTPPPLPPPVSTSVPAFVDVPGDESGPCTGMSGGGSFNLVNCQTGQVTGNWTITEPSGDSASFAGAGIMIGGVAVLATPPSGAYTDDTRSGQGAAVALIQPSSTQQCGYTLKDFDVTGVVAGAY